MQKKKKKKTDFRRTSTNIDEIQSYHYFNLTRIVVSSSSGQQ